MTGTKVNARYTKVFCSKNARPTTGIRASGPSANGRIGTIVNASPVMPNMRLWKTPVSPSARISSAVPATTWLTARLTTSNANSALSATPAAIAASSPSAILPVKYAAAIPKNAPASIAPSIPTLRTPLCSTISSPSAASRIGVAILTVEARNASSITRFRSLRAALVEKCIAYAGPRGRIEREQDQDHHPLDYLHEYGRDAFRALHRLRTIVERAEKHSGWNDCERVEPRDQGDRDRLVAPSG